ncbi:hypothetical protein [Hafnia alvei]|uniref:hypothetical protein n=1 Tax=Hafnia alvei TaxID=569 RepID=UPI00345DFC32
MQYGRKNVPAISYFINQVMTIRNRFSRKRNDMRSLFTLFPPRSAILLGLFVISSYSHMAYSADPGICAPSNGMVPELHIQMNMTTPPVGVTTTQGYSYPVVAAMPGPIKCQPTDPAPKISTVYSFNNGYLGRDAGANITIDDPYHQGYRMRLQLGTVPGFTTFNRWAIPNTSAPTITEAVYAAVMVFPPSTNLNPHDIILNHVFLGYYAVSELSTSDIGIPESTDGLTAVYVSGKLHIPPKCQLQLDKPEVIMPDHFAADFTAAGAGGILDDAPTRLGIQGLCSGGGGSGDGDLVHISISSLYSGDGQNIIGIQNTPEIGLIVRDGQGNILPVNSSEVAQVPTTQMTVGERHEGYFEYPLSFQLVSRTGTAPKPKNYNAQISVILSME